MNSDDIIDRLTKAEKDVFVLKRAQKSGTGNIVGYETTTADEWDIDWTVPGGHMYWQGIVMASFTADSQAAPMRCTTATILVNGSVYINSSDPFIRFIGKGQVHPERTIAAKNSSDFIMIESSEGNNIKIKFHAYATDTGSLLVQSAYQGIG